MEANDSAISVFSDDYYLKSHIKERINLLILKLFWLINYKFPTLLCNQNRFAWLWKDDGRSYEDILWETSTDSSEIWELQNIEFRINLMSELRRVNKEEDENGLNNFLDACKRILEIHAPPKQK